MKPTVRTTKVGGNRNFGYGKSLLWAGKNALQEKYAGGHYATVATHVDHWRLFCQFVKTQRMNDARQITPAMVQAYACQLAEKVTQAEMKVAYAQNLLSSVNIVLGYLRKDETRFVSPATFVGARTTVRQQAPRYLHRDELRPIQQALRTKGEDRLAAQIGLARELMLRFKESCLIDPRKALRQAEQTGYVIITEGTKGGRGKSHRAEVERRVPVTETGLLALRDAATLQGKARNLIPPDYTYAQWREHCYSQARTVGMTGFHDLRAAGACERYQQITGYPAPILATGNGMASAAQDRHARQILMPMLGHSGTRPLSHYLGARHS